MIFSSSKRGDDPIWLTHWIHGTGIFSYIDPNVGKYTVPVPWILWVICFKRPRSHRWDRWMTFLDPGCIWSFVCFFLAKSDTPLSPQTWFTWKWTPGNQRCFFIDPHHLNSWVQHVCFQHQKSYPFWFGSLLKAENFSLIFGFRWDPKEFWNVTTFFKLRAN